MSHIDTPGYRIDSDEQARNWVEELIIDVEKYRNAIDEGSAHPEHVQAGELKKLHDVLLVKHGGAKGVLLALHRCGKLTDDAYNAMTKRITRTLVPSTIVIAQTH